MACAVWTGLLLTSSSAPLQFRAQKVALLCPVLYLGQFFFPLGVVPCCVSDPLSRVFASPLGTSPLASPVSRSRCLAYPCSHLPFSGLPETFLWGFSFCFLKSANFSLVCGKKSSHSPFFSTSVIPAQNLWIYTDVFRNPVQYCMTRGTLGMSLLL